MKHSMIALRFVLCLALLPLLPLVWLAAALRIAVGSMGGAGALPSVRRCGHIAVMAVQPRL